MLVEKFSGRRWEIPSKIFSDSLLVSSGESVGSSHLLDRLARLNYRRVDGDVSHAGEYATDATQTRIDVFLRDFAVPSRRLGGFPVRLQISGGTIGAIERLDSGERIDSFEVEPEPLAGIYERVWEERRIVRLSEVPTILVRAVLAAEDRRFFQHHGIDVRGVLRATIANLRSRRVAQGGSTLTQQLIKNFFLSEARTMSRKLTEAVMALLAERRYTKLEILETYLNEIYLGQRGAKGVYGVWEGSKFYFGKEPKDLSIGEAAMLAGLIKAPSRFAPTRNRERARQRRNEVLAALLEQGEISRAEYEQASAEKLPEYLPTVETTDAPYFVDFVRDELQGSYAEDSLTSEGFRIFTTLDTALQREAERAVAEGIAALLKRYPVLKKRGGGEPVEASLLAIQPATGEIKAMVGGRSYRESQFNRVTQARRQPGSVFKPIVYLTAFEEEERTLDGRFLPTRKLEDTPFTWTYEGREWSPANYKGEYHGTVTLRQALEESLNSATARLAEEVGLDKIHDMALRLGFPSDLPAVPSLVLGSVEVTPLEVARAFVAVANLGFRTEPLSIRAVLDEEGKALTRNTTRAEQAISPRVAYMMTSLMEGVLERGTARSARALGFTAPAAGKTGTTNEGRDAWFVGFTPDLLCVVWVGFDRETPLGLSGAQAALPIWVDFMKTATANRPATPFLVPPGVESVIVDPASGDLATPACPRKLEEVFFQGEAPVVGCPLHPWAGGPAATPTIAAAAARQPSPQRTPAPGDARPVPILFPTATPARRGLFWGWP